MSLAQKSYWGHIKKEDWSVIFCRWAGELVGTHGRDVIEERKFSDVLPIRWKPRDEFNWENLLSSISLAHPQTIPSLFMQQLRKL